MLWFRNDLRLHDNYIVHEAVNKIKSKEYSEVGGVGWPGGCLGGGRSVGTSGMVGRRQVLPGLPLALLPFCAALSRITVKRVHRQRRFGAVPWMMLAPDADLAALPSLAEDLLLPNAARRTGYR